VPIDPISGSGAAGAVSTAARLARGAATPDAGGFAESLQNLVGQVEETAAGANAAVGNMLDKTGDVHDAMIALQRAEMTLELTVQVRNKLVQAYQEIMRMPI
jgi:flagellar hook-basal body complex protein FliE